MNKIIPVLLWHNLINKNKKLFEFQEHIADEIVIAYGSTLEEAFENAALALFELMTDSSTIEPNDEDVFEIRAHDEPSLLYSWIENFIIEFDVNLKLYSKFQIESIDKINGQYVLKGKAWGEVFQPQKKQVLFVLRYYSSSSLQRR